MEMAQGMLRGVPLSPPKGCFDFLKARACVPIFISLRAVTYAAEEERD